ncbi:MAG: hypothetical protein QG561_410 [Patescibacteria group bacterium]|nr:hypothetical protein [Patescibacteria group bacterium]
MEAEKPVEEAPAEKKKTPEEEYAIRLQKADKYLTSKGYTPNDD